MKSPSEFLRSISSWRWDMRALFDLLNAVAKSMCQKRVIFSSSGFFVLTIR
ncbi:hypothetical protein D3C83_178490 [compost metagenome]